MMISQIIFCVCILNFLSTVGNCWVNEEIYHTNQQLEQSTNKLIEQNPNIYIKHECSSDHSIRYMQTNQQLLDKKLANKISAIIACNQHAREQFTAEACLQFMKRLILQEKDGLLKNIKFTIFYNANPHSRAKVMNGQYCIRKNQNGIDINRNFIYRFIEDDDLKRRQSQVYGGQSAMSQSYPQCIDKVAQAESSDKDTINSYLNIHSGQFSFYLPKCDGNQKGYQNQFPILTTVRNKYCPNCIFKQTKYKEGGDSFQDMKCRHKFEYSSVFEIYGGYNRNLEGQQLCFTQFNPTSTQSYNFYLNRTVQMIRTYYQQLIKNLNQPPRVSQQIRVTKIY